MLLSLLSRRTLEADSRDSYGFAVRPQHLQRYREYGGIYKEEEEERSVRWTDFLELCSESSETSTSEVTPKVSQDSPKNKDDSTCDNKSTSETVTPTGSEPDTSFIKEKKRLKVETWEPIRPLVIPIADLMSVRVERKLRLQETKHQQPADDANMCVTEECKENFEDKFTDREVVLEENHKEDSVNNKEGIPNVDDSLTSESAIPWKEELESLVHGGIPKSLRGEVWQAFVGVRVRRIDEYYKELVSPSGLECNDVLGDNNSDENQSDKWTKQIEKDLPRTFPGHPALNDEGRNSLRRILTAYARHNPSVGYCQAMNFFAGLLLLLMPEENAFWTLVGIIDDYFDGYFTQDMVESQVDQLVFEELMRERFPKLVNHLDYLGVEVSWLSGPWFLSIFVNMLPWECVLRIWDVLLFEGNRVMLFRTALALMELYGPALGTTKDAGDVVTLLQSLTGSTFDSSQLVLTACMGFLSVTENRLQELRSKHRPSVLGIVEERTKGYHSKTNIYGFNHDRSPTFRKDHQENDSATNSSIDNFDEFVCALSIDSEIDSLPDLQEQVVWLKEELCRSMDEKRSATLRAEELETALLEMVKQDNRRQLSARVEELEEEVSMLKQALLDSREQEQAMLQVLMRVEQEQKVTEDARIAAEQVATAQKHELSDLQEKYDKALASVEETEKRAVMAESMLEATLQYESTQAKTNSPPRSLRAVTSMEKMTNMYLPFGIGWGDKHKGKSGKDHQEHVKRRSMSLGNFTENWTKYS